MAFRILFFGLGLWIGYVWRRLHPPRDGSTPSLILMVAGGCVVLLVSWAAWQFVAWLFFLPRSLLAYVPFDAFIVGMAAGWILADHHSEAEHAGNTASQDANAPANAASAPDARASSGSGAHWLSSVTSAARTAVTSLGLLILAVLGLAPPHFWGQVFDRLEGFKAAGLEFSLGTAAGQDVAQSILASATATEVLGPNSRQERHGFIAERLQRVHTLTHPHDPEKASATALMGNPTVLDRKSVV